MKIKTKLQFNTALILVLLVLHLGLSYIYFSRIFNQLNHLLLLDTIEESLLELEINLSEHAGAVLYYVGLPGKASLARIEDSQADLERHLREFVDITQAKAPHWFSEKISLVDQQHKEIGNTIVSIAQQRQDLLLRLSVKARAIDELIDEELQATIQFSDPDAVIKHSSALDMEVNIDEAYATIESYALGGLPELKLVIEDAKADFAHFISRYRETPITTKEEDLLSTIEKEFYAALKIGDGVIATTDKLRTNLKYFELQLDQIDYILDEELQIFIHQEIQNESREIKESIQTIGLILVISALLIVVVLSTVSNVISNRIVSSVARLMEGLRHFGQGNLEFRISASKSNDEVDLLATNLNEMAEILQNTTTSRNALLKEIAVRKSVEKELVSSRARFAGILDIAQEAIVSINKAGEIVIYNKGAVATFGYTEEEALGQPIDMLIPKGARKSHHEHIASFTGSDTDTRLMKSNDSLLALHKDGSIFPIEATISKLLSNGVLILTIILRDISERKHVEQKLANHSLLLEQAVEDKTKEMLDLTERMVRQNRLVTIGKIAGNIAHELRNPLGVINQSVYFLKKLVSRGKIDTLTDKIDKSLSLIETELQSANTVISNLLDATRTKAISYHLTDLEKLTLSTTSATVFTHKLDISFELEPNPFLIMVDPGQFKQVITNLLINAMQANSQDLRVTVIASMLPDNIASIQIIDNGHGISADTVEMVFEPLYTTREMGTGLGLSICQQIIEGHGGSIKIDDSSDLGTTVEILLPTDSSSN